MAVGPALEKGDPWRWVVLGLFCVYSCSNAIQWITYSSIATATRAFFNLTTNQLNMLSSVYMIVFVVGAYFTCTTFERWGVRLGVLIGCGLNALGSILKVAPGLQKPCYTTLIIPQALNSVAQLFVLSTPPLIAAQYFAPQQRTFATAIAATANSLGNAIALFAPPLIVKAGTKSEFMLLFCLEMGLCVLITVGVAFFLRPPSFKAPSRALLSELASTQGGSITSSRVAPRRPSQLRRGQREEREAAAEMEDEGEELDSGLESGSDGSCGGRIDSDDEASDGDDKPHSTSERQGQAKSTKKDSSRAKCAGVAEPIYAPASFPDRTGPAVTFAEDGDVSKPRRDGVYSVQDGMVDQTATSYEFDRGSLSKQKKPTLWRRIRHNEHVITFLEVGHSIYLLFRRRDFVFLLGAFSISMGSVWTYASVLAQILEPFGVSAELSGIIGAVNVVVGTVVSYLVGLWVDRTRRYKYPLLACLVGSVLCCIGLMVIMLKAPPNTATMDGLCSFIYIFAGVFQNTAIPICFEFAMEISYPLSESVPGALLMAGANLCSLIMLSISSAMLGNGVAAKSACVNVLILITCVCFVGAVLAFFPREKLYRRDAEREARERMAAESAPTGSDAATTREHPIFGGGSPLSTTAAAAAAATAAPSQLMSGPSGNRIPLDGSESDPRTLVVPPTAVPRSTEPSRLVRKNFADEDLLIFPSEGRQLRDGAMRDDINGATPEMRPDSDEEKMR
jgi:MFS family permease